MTETTELESRKRAATEYIRLHDKRVVQLDRQSIANLRTTFKKSMDAAGCELVYGGPVSKDEFVAAIIDLEFPDIATVRETMTTVAEHDAALAAQIREILQRYTLIPESIIRELAGAMSAYAARQVEAHARSPVSQKGPGRKQAAATRRRSA